MSKDLEISLSSIFNTTVDFISCVCNNIDEKFDNIDEDYTENNLSSHTISGYYFDEYNGNTLLGVESNVNQPFKVGYQCEILSNEISGINGAIYKYTLSDISSDLSTFLTKQCGFDLTTNSNISQKQFLVVINNIASFLYKHINYFVEADKLNLNQLNPFGGIPSTNISKNTLVVYVPTNIINSKPTLSEVLNWETDYNNSDLGSDVMDAKTVNALMSNLFNNYLAVDRVKRYQYAMTVCSSSSSSSCCSSSSCSSSSSSSYFVAYMKLF